MLWDPLAASGRTSAAPFTVEYHHNKNSRFPQETPDDEWLSLVGQKGWIVLSHDAKWHQESAASTAIKQFDIGCFYLHGASIPAWNKLKSFIHNFDKIREICRAETRPFIYKVGASNRLKRIKL
ncbi:MAG: hypothetical protein HQL41_05765 [Alphaproteobacteria bacterium]|nr:hypothetical protein [Alphaproteobacteria bacterium]